MTSPSVRWVRRGLTVLVTFAVIDYLVLPQIAGTRKALDLLGTIRPWWVLFGVALEALSLVSYSLLTRTVLPDQRPAYSWLIRTDVTSLGVSHLLPGGVATASALRYRLLHQGGAPAEDAAVGMAVQGVGSTLVLAAMLWVALIVSIPLGGLHPLYVTVALIGTFLIPAAVVGIVVLSREPASAASALRGVTKRLPERVRPRVERAVEGASEQLHQLLADRRTLRASAGWAAGSWALDAASLWVFLVAFGDRANPVGLLVAYGLANMLAVLPISPGGLGVIEGVLIPSLVGFGTAQAVAVLAVVSWRLFNFWAPIPAAGICYLSLRTQDRAKSSSEATDPRPASHIPSASAGP